MDDSFFRLGAAHHAEEAAYRSTLFTNRLRASPHTYAPVPGARAHTFLRYSIHLHTRLASYYAPLGHYYLVRHAVRHHLRFPQ